MITKTQEFKSDGENTVLDLNNTNINLSSIRLTLKSNGDKIEDFSTIPPKYIILEAPVEEGEVIVVTYETKEVLVIESKRDLETRLLKLEAIVEILSKDNKRLSEALNNRVAIKTFNAWKSLIEAKTGLKFIDTNMTDISTEISNTTNHK